MRKNLWFGLVLIVGLVLVAGCAKAPQIEIDAARAALEAAKTAEASEYAPRALAAAQDAISAMDAELTAQQKKFALFRSYKNAKQLIAAAKTAGDQAAQTAAAEKEKARQEATNLIAQAKAKANAVVSQIQNVQTAIQAAIDARTKARGGK